MATYIKSSTGLVRLDQPVTSETIKQALGYLPVNFSGNYEDLTNKPELFSGNYNDLTNKPELFSGDYEDLTNKPIDGGVWTHESNNFYIVDNNENVIALIDEKGIHSIDFDINGKSVKDHIEDKDIHISAAEREKWNDPLSSNDSELYITDNNGNILALFNIDGLTISAIKTNTLVITNDLDRPTLTADESGLTVTQITTTKINHTDANDLATKTYIKEQIDAINETLNNIDSILEPVEAEIDALQLTVTDIESKTDSIEASENDSTFIITDSAGNAVAQFDESGLTVTQITTNKLNNTDVGNLATKEDINEAISAIPETDLPTVSAGSNINVTKTGLDYKVALNDEITLTKVNATTVSADILETPTLLQDGDNLSVSDVNGNIVAQIDSSGLVVTEVKATKATVYDESSKQYEAVMTPTAVDNRIKNKADKADLTNYYTKSEVDGLIPDTSNFITEVPAEYITETELNTKGYATEQYVTEAIADIDIPETDLSNYYTKSEVDTTISEIESEIDTIQSDVTTIEAKTDNIEASENDSTFVITDSAGHIVAQIDESGLSTTAVYVNGKEVATKDDINTINITYSELKTLRNNFTLVPGKQYRITDYQCTTAQENTQSAGHQFDIIVTADSENILNENARACLHEGNNYFANNDLSAWELKYSLDNDTDRFAWADSREAIQFYDGNSYTCASRYPAGDANNKFAWNFILGNGEEEISWENISEFSPETTSLYFTDTSSVSNINKVYSDTGEVIATDLISSFAPGKGVIYYMKDEFNNECPYDFKNILFTRPYTITFYHPGPGTQYMTRDSSADTNSYFAWKSQYFTFYTTSEVPVLGNTLYSDTSGSPSGYFVEKADSDYTNKYTFTYTENSTSKDASLAGLTTSCYNNIIKEYYDLNKLHLNWIVFYSTSTTSRCYGNTFGRNCYHNTFGYGCFDNTFEYSCYRNTLGYSCYRNTFRCYCSDNTFGSYCSDNTFGGSCQCNTFGSDCRDNTFGSDCNYITFGNASGAISYCQYNIIDNGCSYLCINSTDTTATGSNYLQNIHVHLGVKGSSPTNRKTITVPDRNLKYETNYYLDDLGNLITTDINNQAAYDNITTNAAIYVDSSNRLHAAGFYSNSDKRLKEDIKEYQLKNSILDLPVVEFKYKDTKQHTLGCIAQDLQEICPEIVNETEEGYLSIEESKLSYLLLLELKTLKVEIEELKAEVNKLKN